MSYEIEPGVMAQTHAPSMGLRFVEREVSPGRTVRILQQLYIPADWTRYEEEWRDVPLALSEPPK